MTSPSLRLVALGGLGEVGMNCMVLAAGQGGEEQLILVDCGMTFPDADNGVNVIHPDFTWLLDRIDRLRGVVLTHGHEDHIGALPFLLREIDAQVPVFGPAYALALVRERLEEYPLDEPPELIATRPGERFEVGPFGVTPVSVTHSMPDATALILETPAGTVVHTGDFKIDKDPPRGQHFDAGAFERAGDAGVRLLLSDSTNVTRAGTTRGEKAVRAHLGELIAKATGRVVVAIFASNAHRLDGLLDIAKRHGRKVCLAGRSVRRHARIGTELGHVHDPGGLLVTPREAAALPARELLVLATGTQGEPLAALSRLARGDDSWLCVEAGDTAILSSRIIPGRELAVHDVMNELVRRQVRLVTSDVDPGIHASGHAYRDEQQRMLELVRPQSFIPVHGTPLHLARHADLARAAGITDVLVVENGAVVEVTEQSMAVTETVPTGRVHIDRAGEPVSKHTLFERSRLGHAGSATVVLAVNEDGVLVGTPQVVTAGTDADDELLDEAERAVAKSLAHLGDEDVDVSEHAVRALRRFFGHRLPCSPFVTAVVVEAP